MKTVYILRGLSGSGKSTWANSTAQKTKGSCCIVSADHFFNASGTYKFDPANLQAAHNNCFACFAKAVVQDGIDTVIVDNTNSTNREYANYTILAKICAYKVVILEFHCSSPEDLEMYYHRSEHNVPLYKMQQMQGRWEKDPEAVFA